MAQTVLNSALAIIVAAASLTMAIVAFRSEEKQMQRMPVKAKLKHPRGK